MTALIPYPAKPPLYARLLKFTVCLLSAAAIICSAAAQAVYDVLLYDPTAPGISASATLPCVTAAPPSLAALLMQITGLPETPPVVIPDGEWRIISRDLSSPFSDGVPVNNDTDYTVDTSALAAAKYPISRPSVIGVAYSDEPLVLILHTHATEAYADEGRVSYSPDSLPRSSDPNSSVVAVGAVLAEVLCENGIPTLHCTEMHDLESYRDAYVRSKNTILEYLRLYPSIQYVFDIHRDAVFTASNDIVKALAPSDGRTAQLMFVVGTDSAGADHPDWRNNLNVAVKAQLLLESACPGSVRPIHLRTASFNEQYRTGSLLVEVGTVGNTLDEAKRAALLLGGVLTGLIRGEAYAG